MPTQSKHFNLLFLACCYAVILLSVLAVRARTVSKTRTLSQHARIVPVTSSVPHRTFAAGTMLSTYREHRNTISALAWSPDGKYLASASYDKTVQVWEAATGKHLLTYRGHSDTVSSLAWSPDGSHLMEATWLRPVLTKPCWSGRVLQDILN